MRNLLVFSLVGVVCMACSQALIIDRPEPLVADNAGLVCKKGAPIGSIRVRRMCSTAAQRDRQEQAAEVGMEQRQQEEQAEALRRVFRGE